MEHNCIKFGSSSQYVTIKVIYSFGSYPFIFGSVIQPDIRPDIRVFNSNERNCIKFGVSSQYVIINKINNFGNDPHISGLVIRPDI